jgi:catechol 2,3-dioxygenase-like lactoylglutathione lyase family enzyme
MWRLVQNKEGPLITRTHHTSFTVSDMEEALAFYQGLLGMVVTSDRDLSNDYIQTITATPGAHLRIVYLQIAPESEHRLELIQYLAPADAPLAQRTSQPGCAHLALLVDDLAATYEGLSANGVRFKSTPLDIASGPMAGGKAVYLYGPDGVTLELMQMPI